MWDSAKNWYFRRELQLHPMRAGERLDGGAGFGFAAAHCDEQGRVVIARIIKMWMLMASPHSEGQEYLDVPSHQRLGLR
jgi:hypothetical protein